MSMYFIHPTDGAYMRGMYISCCSRGVISTSKPFSIACIVTANAFSSDEKDPELAVVVII